ncbi:BTAD domain-containing putative transcriptional regulator, partial [Streptomyces sp. URMC 123]|uniref:AfsR/SARP family transcriptional regulator n=1 Tax=Streptomyces sp. URMC 123 TaxID=3423403 RepID=UPI003F1C93AB
EPGSGAGGARGLEFGILGPLRVVAGGRPLPVGGPRQRTILAMMLLAQGRVVSVDRLVDVVWDGRPPATARTQVAICIAGLRKTFKAVGCEDEVIVTAHPGYLLRVDDHRIDAVEFGRLVAEAREGARAGRAESAEALLRQALGLWRGPALAGVAGRPVEGEAAQLEEHRLAAHEEWTELRLELGHHQALIPELADLVREHPLRERPRAQLMLAQYRAGRRAEALEAFREARGRFIEELGLEPGPALLELHDAILRDDPALTPAARPRPYEGRITEPEVIPAHLPAPPPLFVGRAADLAALDALVRGDAGGGAAGDVAGGLAGGAAGGAAFRARVAELPPVAGLITGAAGTGKTALAVRWAHHHAEHFPDGQLFADLGGRDGQPEAAPGDVLGRFLRALGVPEERIPAHLAERGALYRSVLATRRVLLVLDDARSLAQVLPLLPGAGPCRVLVTSRTHMSDVAAECRAVRVGLDTLGESEALDLLRGVAGADRIDAEPGEAARLAALCDRLPLALRTAGARLAAKPHWTVRLLTSRLADERHRLTELSQGRADLRAALDLGYRRLPADAAVLYRRLGLLDAPDFTAWVGAAVLDTDVVVAERLMEHLVDVRLVDTVGIDATGSLRYRFRDLLRLHARECAEADEPADERGRALDRAFRSWLTIAQEAHRRGVGGERVLPRGTTLRRRIEPAYLDELLASPHDWLAAERRSLASVIAQSTRLGRGELAFDLAVSTGLRGSSGAASAGVATAGDTSVAVRAAMRTAMAQGRRSSPCAASSS